LSSIIFSILLTNFVRAVSPYSGKRRRRDRGEYNKETREPEDAAVAPPALSAVRALTCNAEIINKIEKNNT